MPDRKPALNDRPKYPFMESLPQEVWHTISEHMEHPGIIRLAHPSRHDELIYVKVFNYLKNTRKPLSGIEEIRAHAAFYNELTARGFFPPKTFSYIGGHADGFKQPRVPTLITIMPELTIHKGAVPTRLASIPASVLGVDEPVSRDLSHDFNYGRHSDGKLYCHDLHVLEEMPSQAIVDWYRRRQADKTRR